MCDKVGMTPFCPDKDRDAGGDERIHRALVADFSGDVVLETFKDYNGSELAEQRQRKLDDAKDLMSEHSLDKAADKTYTPNIDMFSQFLTESKDAYEPSL